MKPHRSSLYATFAAVALGLIAGFWWSRAPDRMRPAPFANRTADAATGTAGSKIVTPEPRTSPEKPAADATVKRIRDLLETLEPVLPGETENKTALELLHWWAEIDPASAIAYAQAHPALHGRAELPAELFIKWLDAHRDVAIAWATTLPLGALRSGLLPAVISIVAETRPLDALTMTSELEGENRRLALSSLFTEWSTVDPVARSGGGAAPAHHGGAESRLASGHWKVGRPRPDRRDCLGETSPTGRQPGFLGR